MSIPAYQFPSLATENEAKRRVIKTAKKGVETEEQRAIKSGKIDDNIKNIFKAIISNLELQISTLQVGKAMGANVIGEGGVDMGDVDDGVVSKVVGTLGRLVRLSSQFVTLIDGLKDLAIGTNRPTFDTAKILNLIKEVDEERGEFNRTGFGLLLGAVTAVVEEEGKNPDNIYGLDFLYNENLTKGIATLNSLDNNEYQTELESIYIPLRKGRRVNLDRQEDLRTGRERRLVTGAEYKILLGLKADGILHDDDFSSLISGRSGSSISSGSIGSSEDSGTTYYVEESSDSDDDTASSASSRSSANPFGDFRYVPRRRGQSSASSASSGLQLDEFLQGNLEGYGLSGGAVYSIPLQPKRTLNMASGYAYPLRYY